MVRWRAITGLCLMMLAFPGLAGERPAQGPSESIGGAALGCLRGAVALPEDGPGWQVLRPDHNRFWGNPALIRFIEDLAAVARPMGSLLIGDLSLPRGGHMPSSHGSHQTGLDADILFRLAGHPLTEEEREHPDFTSVLSDGVPAPARWGAAQLALLKAAAGDSRVERIFVNPAIKRYLCRTTRGDRGWLRRIRPWWGHEAHFHVRLRCPANEPDCRPGPAIPPGDGCDGTLAWWFTPEAGPLPEPAPRQGPRPRYLPSMPAACKAILDPRSIG